MPYSTETRLFQHVLFKSWQGICALHRNLKDNQIMCNWYCHRNAAVKECYLDSANYSACSSRCVPLCISCILYVCIVFFFLFLRRMQGINLTQTRRALESHQIDSVLRFECLVLLQYTFTTYYKLDRVGKMIERYILECREIELGRLQPSLTGRTEHINLLGLQKAAVQLVSESNSSNAKLEVCSYYNLNNNPHSAHLYFPCQRTKGMIALSPLL